MNTTKLTAVNNTENIFKLILSADGSVIDHTTILAAELRTALGQTLADSDVDATDWDFTNPSYLTVQLGLAAAPAGVHKCILIIRDAAHSTGLAWDGTQLNLTILP